MTEKDFILNYAIAHAPLPKDADPIEYARFLWERAQVRGVGKTVSKTAAKKQSFFSQLKAENTMWFDCFVEFFKAWSVNDDTRGKDQAAEVWLFLCRAENYPESKLKHIIYAGGVYAKGRPAMRERSDKPIMAYRYLKLRRFDDVKPYSEKKLQNKSNSIANEMAELKGQIEHAKNQQKTDTTDFWKDEEIRMNNKLRELSLKADKS